MLSRRFLPLILATLAFGACAHGRARPAREPAARRSDRAAAHRHAAAEERVQPAAPAETRFRLCMLHPASVHGLRTVEAVRRVGEPDTFAILDDRRVPLDRAIGDVRVAGQTAWFRARRDLEVPLGGGRAPRRFAIYDVSRIIEGGQLTYLGTVDGLPLFAASDDAAPMRAELGKLLATDTDLPKLLASNARLRNAFRALQVVYVPLRPTGCVFQALLRDASPPAPRPTAAPRAASRRG